MDQILSVWYEFGRCIHFGGLVVNSLFSSKNKFKLVFAVWLMLIIKNKESFNIKCNKGNSRKVLLFLLSLVLKIPYISMVCVTFFAWPFVIIQIIYCVLGKRVEIVACWIYYFIFVSFFLSSILLFGLLLLLLLFGLFCANNSERSSSSSQFSSVCFFFLLALIYNLIHISNKMYRHHNHTIGTDTRCEIILFID